ncbi:GAF domain-containing sensor histidine kinase [Adhaeribacter aquaticus]|uniref:GAF domain-containing sensor histidine kinase n=1 Tax=Adhaeribacter aquaticus TaxID=299567 RepID=UPI0003FECC9B|nr:GAF domain-containing sensor histidine kinase [Adhaeribacter aquaticus]
MISEPPIPENEFNRILDLSELDLDYTNLEKNFKDLTKLAAWVAGTDISLLNLIDSFTQWTISNYGLPIEQMPREESVCQYTIMEDDKFEVQNLTLDDRFKDKPYVVDHPQVRYYFGVPLKTKNGNNIGALCVLDTNVKVLTPEKIEMLKVIADEIVNRLMALKAIQTLTHNVTETKEVNKRLAHDIRGPIGGIIGLAQIISEKGDKNTLSEVLEFINLIQKSGNSLLELADEILNSEVKASQKNPELKDHELNLQLFKDKLEKLYLPQAKNKEIDFTVTLNPANGIVPFPKNKLLQITGNLISNAIKFTPPHGRVSTHLDIELGKETKTLFIEVSDSGVGLTSKGIEDILSGSSSSSANGTKGEQGYGFGLPLVKFLIDSFDGSMSITSSPGAGTSFRITLPIK